jgi:hypothetical protein|tara:strand:+ start:124 stop:600 length:477 start_codon:yes stop_codon:yes gene_type:complete
MKNMIILLRILAIIPFLTGSLLLYERILPDEVIETSIISKHVVTRTEDGRTESTYRVNFEGLHEKVSRKMYEIINEGDVIQLKVTPYMKQVSFFKIDERVGWIENADGERFALFIFALAFFFGAIGVQFKKERFSIVGFIYYVCFIGCSIIMLGKMDL